MLLAKLPPPSPAVAAATRKKAYGVAEVADAGHEQRQREEQQQRTDHRPVAAAELATANV